MAKNVDLVNGKMFPSLVKFTIPVIIANLIQTLYSIVSGIVVGRYESSVALGAVGSATPVISIIQTIFWGMSLGTNVLAASSTGAGDSKRVKAVTDTGILMAILSGIIVYICGQVFAIPIVNAMKLDPEIHDMAIEYMQLFFIGLPFHALFSYSAAALRAIGDAKRPMYASAFAGIINLILNILFVKYMRLGVRGAGYAMVLSHLAAAVFGITALYRSTIGFSFFKMRPNMKILWETVKIGLPSGLQNALISLSSLIGVSVLNSFGAVAVAGNAIVNEFGIIINTVVSAITVAIVPFVSQNIGAKKHHKLRKFLYMCWGLGAGASLLFIIVFALFKYQFFNMFISEKDLAIKDDVLSVANIRFMLYVIPYFLVAIAEVPANMLKGMGKTIVPLVVGLLASCGFRVIWQLVILPMHRSLGMLFAADLVVWVISAVVYTMAYIYFEKKLMRENLTAKVN